ncbi:6-phosphogluconate dehydrogenase, partial [Methylobacterium frigidaeris]|uniref:NAD(P)-dependent oxidoreductase n=1 Tax=Methylobacterium frigidaeris TaxID=2038277 RepID=UPI000C53D4DE
MGREMARNLLRAGHPVRAYDVRAEAVAELSAEGAVAATSPADAARGAEIAITMLPDTPHVEAVVYGEHGLLESPPAGRVVVDMSTISPVAVRRMAADLAKAGIAFLDAPVSGGPVGAKNAALSIMVGGSAEAFAKARGAGR